MNKINIIFISSFPTNNEILHGLFDFLNDYFNVISIEIPGFSKNLAPLAKPSFKNVTSYIQNQISNQKIDSYWLGCASMSYFICKELIKDIEINKKCKGILAFAPYINSNFLSKEKRRKFNLIIFNTILFFRLHHSILRTKLFKKFLLKNQYPKNIVEYMIKYMDTKTLFLLAKEVLTCKVKLEKLDKPHVVLVNEKDDFIDTNKTISEYRKKIKNILILKFQGKHCPEDASKKYFEYLLSKKDMKKIMGFINQF